MVFLNLLKDTVDERSKNKLSLNLFYCGTAGAEQWLLNTDVTGSLSVAKVKRDHVKGPHLFPFQNRAKTCESESKLYLVYNTTTTPSQFCSEDKWYESNTPPRHIPIHKHKIRRVNVNLKWAMLNSLRLLGLTTVDQKTTQITALDGQSISIILIWSLLLNIMTALYYSITV